MSVSYTGTYDTACKHKLLTHGIHEVCPDHSGSCCDANVDGTTQ